METWAYCPQRDVTEGLEWLTDIQRCRSAEYRQILRKAPRQELSYSFHLTPAQFGQAKILARALGASSFFVPLWPMFRATGPLASGATAVPKDMSDSFLLFDIDTSVLIWESASKWEVHTVEINSSNPAYPYLTLTEAITQDYADPVIVPLRVGEFAQEFEATRTSLQLVEASARFRILIGDDYSGDYSTRGGLYSDVTYSSHKVVTDRSLVASGVREQFERRFEEVDSVTGGAYRYPSLSTAEQATQITWGANTAAELRSLLWWIHSRKGQAMSFWVPSWNGDLTVTAEIGATDTTIEIADIGLRTNGTFPIDLMIVTTDGTRIFCRATGATAGTSGHEVLSLSAQFGTHLYTWDISQAQMIVLSRFASDRLEISYGPAGRATVTAPICEVPL